MTGYIVVGWIDTESRFLCGEGLLQVHRSRHRAGNLLISMNPKGDGLDEVRDGAAPERGAVRRALNLMDHPEEPRRAGDD